MKNIRSLFFVVLCLIVFILAVGTFSFLRRPTPTVAASITLTDVTKKSGVEFTHCDGHSGERFIVETISSGLGSFDYDSDGLIDIYFVNGSVLIDPSSHTLPHNALYRNRGGFSFEDVSKHAGVDDTSFGVGVTAADCDNDGFQDLYVSNFGINKLFHNNGDGTFCDITESSGVGRREKVGAGSTFLDIDADGDLDLYVAHYVKFTFENHVVISKDGHPQYAGPRSYEPETHELFRNNGDHTFSDVSESSGIARHPGSGMGVISGDFDNDSDTDLFVLNDVFRNFMFRNNGKGVFEEVGLQTGAAFNGNGDELGSMGIDCADYDHDGWLDCVVTSYEGEMPVLFHNLGNGSFEDATAVTHAGESTAAHVKWGVGMIDFDNDSFRDIFYACGHLQDNIDLTNTSTSYRVRNVLLKNDRGVFRDVSRSAGTGLASAMSSRGAAFDDFDNDGRIDVAILNARDRSTILRNESHSGHHWFQLRLIGTSASRDSIGARVRIDAGGTRQYAEVHNGRGYQSHYGARLHFGLGVSERVDRIEIQWLGGNTRVLADVPVDQLLTVLEEDFSERFEDHSGT